MVITMFGNESTFKYYGNNDTFSLNNGTLNSHYFGNDDTFKFSYSTLNNETPFTLNDVSNAFKLHTPFGDETTFLNLANTENDNLNTFTINNESQQLKLFGNNDTFISKIVDNLSENNTYNTSTYKQPNIPQKIFGNSYDFEYCSSENQSIDVQSLLSESQQVQATKFWQKDCGQIDIGNFYANYEIQRPCDQPCRRYARYCPCNNGNCNNNNNCNSNCGCKNNNKPDCKKVSAEKLARKIYQQIIYASSCVAQLISQCSCPHTRQQLVEVKSNLDTLGISMLAITKVLCKCNPIYMNNLPDFKENNFKHNLNKTIELLSIITQNLVHLQKLPEAKCYNMAILLITYGIIRQQNVLISIISKC